MTKWSLCVDGSDWTSCDKPLFKQSLDVLGCWEDLITSDWSAPCAFVLVHDSKVMGWDVKRSNCGWTPQCHRRGVKQVRIQQAIETFYSRITLRIYSYLNAPGSLRSILRITNLMILHWNSMCLDCIRKLSKRSSMCITKTTSEPHNPQIGAEMLQRQTWHASLDPSSFYPNFIFIIIIIIRCFQLSNHSIITFITSGLFTLWCSHPSTETGPGAREDARCWRGQRQPLDSCGVGHV